MVKGWVTETEQEHGHRYLRVSRSVRDVNGPGERVLCGRIRAPRALGGAAWLALVAALTVHEALEQTVGSRLAHGVPGTPLLRIGEFPPPPDPKGAGFEPIPSIKPRQPTPSLLTVARGLPAGFEWRTGISWRSAVCAPGFRWPFCPDAETVAAGKPDPNEIIKPQFYPYTIGVNYACDWIRWDDTNEYGYIDDAKAQCDAVTPWHMSRELWTGEIEPQNPSLISVAVDVSADVAVHPVTALGMLLEAYFNCPADGTDTGSGTGTPVVHVPYSVLGALIANHVVNQQGDFYVGPNCFVSPGPGYPIGSDAAPANENDSLSADAWMYVSGPIEYAVDPVAVLDDNFDRRTNRYQALAERRVIHRFDPCCVFAVGVYVPSPIDPAMT
jgi:hypothetical protein